MKKNSCMYLTAGKQIETKVSVERPLVGPEHLEVVIPLSEETDKGDEKAVELVLDKTVRTTARFMRCKDGNVHFITTVPKRHSSAAVNNVLLRTKHGTLREHQKTYSMYFSFAKEDVDMADTLEDEASEMADYMLEKGGRV